MSAPKVTYITLSADSDELAADFDRAIAQVKAQLGRTCLQSIDGQVRQGPLVPSFNPADRQMEVAHAAAGCAQDARDAVAAAGRAYPGWSGTPWRERASILGRAAGLIRERRLELATWLILEMGKNRVEALGEIEETADLIDYYISQLTANDGYVKPMASLSPADQNISVLRPYGVWAVIAPWNFPFALLGAPVAAALLAGNTVVAKPSTETPLSGTLLAEIFLQAGVPGGAINLVMGDGLEVGGTLVSHPQVAGVTFTGSYDVGFRHIYQRFAQEFPKPAIVEMGGKNPAIVMAGADLERAALGVFRSAFGMNGHKCSACSRVYVQRSVLAAFVEKLVVRTEAARVGDPLERTTFNGPLATPAGYANYQKFVALAQQEGNVVTGGKVMTEGPFAHGLFVQPTIVTGLPGRAC